MRLKEAARFRAASMGVTHPTFDITNASTGLNGCPLESRSCGRLRLHAWLRQCVLFGASRSVFLRQDRHTVTAVLAQKGCHFLGE